MEGQKRAPFKFVSNCMSGIEIRTFDFITVCFFQMGPHKSYRCYTLGEKGNVFTTFRNIKKNLLKFF